MNGCVLNRSLNFDSLGTYDRNIMKFLELNIRGPNADHSKPDYCHPHITIPCSRTIYRHL